MLLITDNIYAGRLNEQGDVRLVQFINPPVSPPVVSGIYHSSTTVFDVTIPGTQWPAVVAYVSKRGDIEGRHYLIQAFHQNVEPFAQAAGLMAQANETP